MRSSKEQLRFLAKQNLKFLDAGAVLLEIYTLDGYFLLPGEAQGRLDNSRRAATCGRTTAHKSTLYTLCEMCKNNCAPPTIQSTKGLTEYIYQLVPVLANWKHG